MAGGPAGDAVAVLGEPHRLQAVARVLWMQSGNGHRGFRLDDGISSPVIQAVPVGDVHLQSAGNGDGCQFSRLRQFAAIEPERFCLCEGSVEEQEFVARLHRLELDDFWGHHLHPGGGSPVVDALVAVDKQAHSLGVVPGPDQVMPGISIEFVESKGLIYRIQRRSDQGAVHAAAEHRTGAEEEGGVVEVHLPSGVGPHSGLARVDLEEGPQISCGRFEPEGDRAAVGSEIAHWIVHQTEVAGDAIPKSTVGIGEVLILVERLEVRFDGARASGCIASVEVAVEGSVEADPPLGEERIVGACRDGQVRGQGDRGHQPGSADGNA